MHIGLELGFIYITLGARLELMEMMGGLMQGADRDLVNIWKTKVFFNSHTH